MTCPKNTERIKELEREYKYIKYSKLPLKNWLLWNCAYKLGLVKLKIATRGLK